MLSHPSPPRSPGPADRARIALLDYWDEPDAYVGKLAGCSATTARRARIELEHLGVIPHREPDLSEDAWRPGRTWHDAAGRTPALSPSQRACLELEADPRASDQRLAERAACARTVVRDARRELERLGAIPVVDAWERDRRPGSGRGEQRTPRGHADSDLARHITLTPAQPASLSRGLCVTGGHDPDLWHAGRYDHAQRQQAIAICQRCPAVTGCAAWSLSLPATDRAIYGAMTWNERMRRRAAQPAP